jgi:hypothetical protein
VVLDGFEAYDHEFRRMKVFRTICRVDFPVTFTEIDRLGEHTQTLHERTIAAPFADVKNNLNILTHSTNSEGKVNGMPFKFNLSPKNLNFTIEYLDGLPIDSIASTPLFDLLAELLPKMAPKRVYERIGVRSFVLAGGTRLKFRSILDTLMNGLGSLREPLTKGATLADVGITVEVDDRHMRHGRLHFGPYSAGEWVRYFEHQPSLAIEEGVIFDIDTSMAKLELPGLDLRKFVKGHQLMIAERVGGVIRGLEGVLE